jgi:glutathione S-transferase
MEWARREAQKAKDGLRYFDKLLEPKPFVTGDRSTTPDIALFAGIYFAEALKLMPDGLPALRKLA